MSDQRQRIENIKIKGLLSFGQVGIDLPLQDLNVFIGANASGKSNFFEVLNLLKGLPSSFQQYMQSSIDAEEFIHRPVQPNGQPSIETTIAARAEELKRTTHIINLWKSTSWFVVDNELILDGLAAGGSAHYSRKALHSKIFDERSNKYFDINVNELESVLSQIKDSYSYPDVYKLQEFYSSFRLYRDWSFGPKSSLKTTATARFFAVILIGKQ